MFQFLHGIFFMFVAMTNFQVYAIMLLTTTHTQMGLPYVCNVPWNLSQELYNINHHYVDQSIFGWCFFFTLINILLIKKVELFSVKWEEFDEKYWTQRAGLCFPAYTTAWINHANTTSSFTLLGYVHCCCSICCSLWVMCHVVYISSLNNEIYVLCGIWIKLYACLRNRR